METIDRNRIDDLFERQRVIRFTSRAPVAVEVFTHLYLLSRGILMTPFHNMALMSPATADDLIGT